MEVITYPDCSPCCGESVPTVEVACSPSPVPTILYATVLANGSCAAYAGTYPITWNGGAWQFGGGSDFSVTLNCMGTDCSGWQCNVVCGAGGGPVFTSVNGVLSCTSSPFEIVFNSEVAETATIYCCDGTVSVTITE